MVSAFNGYGIKLENSDGNVELSNIITGYNLIYNFYASGDGSKSITNSYVLLPQGVWENTNYKKIYSESPLFVSPGTGDFRLRSDSPCIDRGAVITGLHNQSDLAKDVYGNLVSDTPDIGAYEYVIVDDSSPLSLTDAIIVFKILSGRYVSLSLNTDADNNGKIELKDAIFILQEVSDGM